MLLLEDLKIQRTVNFDFLGPRNTATDFHVIGNSILHLSPIRFFVKNYPNVIVETGPSRFFSVFPKLPKLIHPKTVHTYTHDWEPLKFSSCVAPSIYHRILNGRCTDRAGARSCTRNIKVPLSSSENSSLFFYHSCKNYSDASSLLTKAFHHKEIYSHTAWKSTGVKRIIISIRYFNNE